MEPPNLESLNSLTWKWVKLNQLGKINIKKKKQYLSIMKLFMLWLNSFQ